MSEHLAARLLACEPTTGAPYTPGVHVWTMLCKDLACYLDTAVPECAQKEFAFAKLGEMAAWGSIALSLTALQRTSP